MNGVFQHPLRVTGRLFWLAGEFLLAALNYTIRCVGCPHDSLPLARAGWLQRSSRRVLRVFRLETKTTGNLPASGLLVCNHLSYLDILVLASLVPCIFVAKHEVKRWPVFGWYAKLAGTVFVHRARRSQTGSTVRRIDAALRTGALLVLFPEGTSSGGETVLPFKSALLEPATRQPYSLTAGFLRYELADGKVSEEVCYWKDMTLVPHLVNLCSKRSIQASVHFNRLREGSTDRKQLARELHAEVQRMQHAVAI